MKNLLCEWVLYSAQKITNVSLEENSKNFEFISDSWRNLLKDMLNYDPIIRPSIDDIINHKWIATESIFGLEESVYREMKYRSDLILKRNYQLLNNLISDENTNEILR